MYDRQSKAFEMTGVCVICCTECECAKAKDTPDIMEYFLHRGYPAEKTFNLCCIQNKGLENFAREAASIKEKWRLEKGRWLSSIIVKDIKAEPSARQSAVERGGSSLSMR